jgi:hypothetical protein
MLRALCCSAYAIAASIRAKMRSASALDCSSLVSATICRPLQLHRRLPARWGRRWSSPCCRRPAVFRRRWRFDNAWRDGVALQVGQGDTQAAPFGVRQFAPQRTDCLRPVNGFASARDDNHRAFGFGGIGRFPQGQESVDTGLAVAAVPGRDCSLKCCRFFLTTLRQWLAFGRFFFGGFFAAAGAGSAASTENAQGRISDRHNAGSARR